MSPRLFVIVAVVCALCLSSYSSAQIDRNKPGAGIAFAYANSAGTRLLALQRDDDFKPTFLGTAICSESREAPVRYLQFQKKTARDNGRQSTGNFSNDEGHLFEVLSAPIEPGDTCLLVPSEFLKNAPIIRNEFTKAERDAREKKYIEMDEEAFARNPELFLPSGDFARAAIRRIEEAKGWKVRQYWPLHRWGGTQEVAMVEFQPAGDSLLASLVLVAPDGLSFFDMPAKRDENGISCWRVDDGCALHLPQMSIPAVFRAPDAPLILFGWWGAEGHSITLFQPKEGKLIDVKNGYRYHAPI
jgi:hypothetical protein